MTLQSPDAPRGPIYPEGIRVIDSDKLPVLQKAASRLSNPINGDVVVKDISDRYNVWEPEKKLPEGKAFVDIGFDSKRRPGGLGLFWKEVAKIEEEQTKKLGK